MRQINKKCVIFSGEHKDVGEEMNDVSTLCVRRYLEERNYAFKPLIGCYKGQAENSFLVEFTDESGTLEDILSLARLYNQETVLLLDEDRNASLIRIEETIDRDVDIELGKLSAVSRVQASGLDSWTYCRDANQYYGIVA